MKKCSQCKSEKDINLFNSHKNTKDKKSPVCKDCQKKYSHKSYLKNKEKVKIRNDLWRLENSEKWREFRKNSYWKNPEEARKNGLAHTVKRSRYKAHPLSKIYAEKINEIYKKRPDGFHVDHIIPLIGKNVCGLHVPWNLQYLTIKENLKKGNRI